MTVTVTRITVTVIMAVEAESCITHDPVLIMELGGVCFHVA